MPYLLLASVLLEFEHPATGERIRFEIEPPVHITEFIKDLKKLSLKRPEYTMRVSTVISRSEDESLRLGIELGKSARPGRCTRCTASLGAGRPYWRAA